MQASRGISHSLMGLPSIESTPLIVESLGGQAMQYMAGSSRSISLTFLRLQVLQKSATPFRLQAGRGFMLRCALIPHTSRRVCRAVVEAGPDT